MPSGAYTAVKDFSGTGRRREILFNGEPIPHVPYTKSSADDFSWGYRGAGPSNVARSILEHAIDEAHEEIDVTPAEHQFDFRNQFISPRTTGSEGWSIDFVEVISFLKQKEKE